MEENSTIICEVLKLQGFSTRLFAGILSSRKKDEGFLQGEDYRSDSPLVGEGGLYVFYAGSWRVPHNCTI